MTSPSFKLSALVLLVVIICMSLVGCAEWYAVRSAIEEEGATAADEALDVAIFQICRGSPVGAVLRRFKTDEERQAYRVLCGTQLPLSQLTASN
jgi:hypothetical protein